MHLLSDLMENRIYTEVKGKGKEEYLYSSFLHQGTHKALRHGSHSFTCKQHHACLSFVSVHQINSQQCCNTQKLHYNATTTLIQESA